MVSSEPLPRFDSLGESALLVTFGAAPGLTANAKALSLARSLAESPLPGVLDSVPAYASALILFDPERQEVAQLEHAIRERLSGNWPNVSHGRTFDIPVRYGGLAGPDLQSLAERHKLSPADVVRLHAGRLYRVFFIGFMPGFPYMGTVPPKIATPRLATPRVRVPAGSVGIAGDQTGIYPLSSPGGWQIIGRTGVKLWDPSRSEPSLLLPGDTVRFMPSDADLDFSQQASPTSIHTERPTFEITSGGGMTTVQDCGRPGYSHVGLSRGGVFDRVAACRANALCGNEAGDAVLELTWSGPEMRALANVLIALDGADLGCMVDGVRVPLRMAWFVRKGATMRFAPEFQVDKGARGYLAVSGGIDAPLLLDSRSTYLPGGFEGIAGRPLQVGDTIGTVGSSRWGSETGGRFWSGRVEPVNRAKARLRFVQYRGPGAVGNSATSVLNHTEWVVTDSSNRMGIRLRPTGTEAIVTRSGGLTSFGVVLGAIQLPPDGNPVILGPDHQTTGGYPVAGVVIAADIPVLAQLRPGDSVLFSEITLAEALAASLILRRYLRDRVAALHNALW